MECFIYEWCECDEVDDDTRNTKFMIRGYGIDRMGKDVVVVIDDFPPYMYVELPSNRKWEQNSETIKSLMTRMEEGFERLHCRKPKVARLMYKKKLYYYDRPQKALYPFIFIAFHSKTDRISCSRFLVKQKRFAVYGQPVDVKCHEHEASPLLQFLSFRDLPSAGWVKVSGQMEEGSLFHCDIQINASYKGVERPASDINEIPSSRKISFDIEVNSSDRNKMPDPRKKDDVIFQISCIYEYEQIRENILLTLGKTNLVETEFENSTTIVHHFNTEKDLLMGFKKLIVEKNPHILLGYNIFGFDIPYMIDRAKFHNIFFVWSMHGRLSQTESQEKLISWSSSAYQNQEFRFLELEGRIQIDLLPIIRRDYKLRNYKLSTVAQHFLGSSKDPLTAQDIFSFYRRGVGKQDEFGQKLLTCVGRYCLQDAILVLDLFHKLQTWIGLIEMAKLCNTSIHALYTQGQQIKVFSQIYKICMHKHIVVESSLYHKNQISQYMGAYVFDPMPGIYNNVIPFDFSSLYPSVIMAYNIDYTTFVQNDSIPDTDCHVIEWKEEENDKHYRFRFIKEPKGMLPALLEDLLSQRKKTKSEMKSLSKDSLMYTVLDKRQLAYKVSANSMYGAMGVTKGYLPFLPGAMSTTAKGRQSIQKAAEYVQKTHHGHLIYGDSVAHYTPIIIRHCDRIHIGPVEDVLEMISSSRLWMSCAEYGKETKQHVDLKDVYTWTEKGWTRLYRIIRHKLAPYKKMVRVVTETAIVDVTDDHSLLDRQGRVVSTKSMGMDTLLMHSELPSPKEIATLYHHNCNGGNDSCMIARSLMNDIKSSDKDDLEVVMEIDANTQTTLQSLIFYAVEHGWHWQFSVSDELEHSRELRIHFTKENVRNQTKMTNMAQKMLRIQELEHDKNAYVYDLTTENHHFAAGIGNMIVHNTDSIYCHFPHVQVKDLWNFALSVEKEFLHLFPDPMRLVFEEKMYSRFLIFTKKRYLALTQNQDLSIDKDLTIRGVLLARRDNCLWIRYIYENLVRRLMDPHVEILLEDVQYFLIEEFNKLFSHYWDLSYITITKAVGKDYKVKSCPGYDERTLQITDYKKWGKRMDELGIHRKSVSWLQEYKEKVMPAHAQLACKMKRRGIPVEAGSRIEFIMVQHEDLKAKSFKKIEDPDYQRTYSDIIRIDYLYVLHLASNPLDQLLNVCFKIPTFVRQQYELRMVKQKVLIELESLFSPNIKVK